MKIVLTRRLPGTYTSDLIDFYDEVAVFEEERPLSPEELKKALDGAHAAIIQLTDKLDENSYSESLKCVITYSVGYEHIKTKLLKDNHCIVSHTPGVLTEATADLTWALILACSRRIIPAVNHLKENQFKGYGPELFLGRGLSGKTIGIVGMGRIGTAVAQRAIGFGMKVLYHNRNSVDEELEDILSAKNVDLKELLQKSDVVSFHCPLTDETREMIGPEELSWTKSDAVLVNTARGALWDEESLIRHLKARRHTFVGIDVYAKEPQVPPELITLPNVVALPHIGSADLETREQMAKICIEEAIRFAKGDELRYELKL